jgi:hypothetical protein
VADDQQKPRQPSGYNLDTSPYDEDQVRAGDFPAGATAKGTRIESDGSIWTFIVPLVDFRAALVDGTALALDVYHLELVKLPGVLRDAMADGATTNALRSGGSKGGKRKAERARKRACKKKKRLLLAVRRLEQGVPPPKPGEIVDKLLDEHGPEYDARDAESFEKAREAMRKRIRDARAAEENPDG